MRAKQILATVLATLFVVSVVVAMCFGHISVDEAATPFYLAAYVSLGWTIGNLISAAFK